MPTGNNKWTIENITTSEPVGNDLNGLHIKKTGTGYELRGKIASVTATAPPFTFEGVTVDGENWNINVVTLPEGGNGTGTWQLNDSLQGDPVDGDFTAQAGDDDDAEASASATA